MGTSFGADLGGAIKEDLLAMEVNSMPVSTVGANSCGIAENTLTDLI